MACLNSAFIFLLYYASYLCQGYKYVLDFGLFQSKTMYSQINFRLCTYQDRCAAYTINKQRRKIKSVKNHFLFWLTVNIHVGRIDYVRIKHEADDKYSSHYEYFFYSTFSVMDMTTGKVYKIKCPGGCKSTYEYRNFRVCWIKEYRYFRQKKKRIFYFTKSCKPCNCHRGAKCHDESGSCEGSGCRPGYAGTDCLSMCPRGKFGLGCNYKCSVHCVDNNCSHVDGACDCNPGYEKPDCRKKCSPGWYGSGCSERCHHCYLKKPPCDSVTGQCKPARCLAGYSGAKCDLDCPHKSFGVNCSGFCHCFENYNCDQVTGDCGTHGCGKNYFGKSCNIYRGCPAHTFGKLCTDCGKCYIHCDNKTKKCNGECLESGVCPLGCAPDFIGERCDTCITTKYGRRCGSVCGNCENNFPCHAITGICLNHACEPGHLGHKCDLVCRDGLWGEACALSCSGHCKDDKPCDSEDGSCEECKRGWMGYRCEDVSTCPDPGKWGDNCEKNCFNCKEGTTCSKVNGTCSFGCKPGYYGDQCNFACDVGYWGENCVEQCGLCHEWAHCDRFTGFCAQGCVGHFIAPKCTVCEVGYMGHQCDQQCGHCQHNLPCNRITGSCENGCLEGFTGPFCQDRMAVVNVLDMEDVISEWKAVLGAMKQSSDFCANSAVGECADSPAIATSVACARHSLDAVRLIYLSIGFVAIGRNMVFPIDFH